MSKQAISRLFILPEELPEKTGIGRFLLPKQRYDFRLKFRSQFTENSDNVRSRIFKINFSLEPKRAEPFCAAVALKNLCA